MAAHGPSTWILDVAWAKLGNRFFNPIGAIIMVVGMGATFRTANGSASG